MSFSLSENIPKSMSAGALPQTPWRRLQRSPDPLAGFKGPLRGRRGMDRRTRGRAGKGNGEWTGKKLGDLVVGGVDASAPGSGYWFGSPPKSKRLVLGPHLTPPKIWSKSVHNLLSWPNSITTTRFWAEKAVGDQTCDFFLLKTRSQTRLE